MEFIEQGSVVMLTSGITTSTGMLPMLSSAAVSVANITTQLAGLPESGHHLLIISEPKRCPSILTTFKNSLSFDLKYTLFSST
jgi:hypothetical protein